MMLSQRLAIANSEYRLGSISRGCPPADEAGVWKKMDGIENLHPGSGIEYRTDPANDRALYFEKVA